MNYKAYFLAAILLSVIISFVGAASTNCASQGATVNLAWSPLQAINEAGQLSATIYNYVPNQYPPPQCTTTQLPNQRVSFYVDGKQFGSTVYTNGGTATLNYNTSQLGLGNHSVYALWYGNQSISNKSMTEYLNVVKRNSSIQAICTSGCNLSSCVSGSCSAYSIVRGTQIVITTYLSSGEPYLDAHGTSYLNNQQVSVYIGSQLIGTGITNSSGQARIMFNSSILTPGSYHTFATYSGDANDSPASTQNWKVWSNGLFYNTTVLNPAATTTPTTVLSTIQASTSIAYSSSIAQGIQSGNQTDGLGTTSMIGLGVIVLIIIVAALFFMSKRKPSSKSSRGKEDTEALKTLKQRYAKGEITKKEYNEMRKELED